MITVSYNAYCAISKGGDNDIWTIRPRGVVPLLPLCSQIDVGATVNALFGDTFSRENNTHGSRFHDPGSTICFTNFGSHDPIVLHWNPWYTEPCYKGSLLYVVNLVAPSDTVWRHKTWSTLVQALAWCHHMVSLAWWHQANTWTNNDLSSVRSSDFHLRSLSRYL